MAVGGATSPPAAGVAASAMPSPAPRPTRVSAAMLADVDMTQALDGTEGLAFLMPPPPPQQVHVHDEAATEGQEEEVEELESMQVEDGQQTLLVQEEGMADVVLPAEQEVGGGCSWLPCWLAGLPACLPLWGGEGAAGSV